MKKSIVALLPILFLVPISMLVSVSVVGQKKAEWVAPVEADELTNPLKNDKEAFRKGRVIFTNECVICHGANGDGVSNVAKNMEQKPKDFTVDGFLNQSDGAIFWKLSEGRGLMQPFKTMLTEEEIWSVVEYVKFLSKDGE